MRLRKSQNFLGWGLERPPLLPKTESGVLGFGMDSLGQADTSEKRLKAGEGPQSRRFGFLERCKMFTLAGSLPLPSGVLLPGGPEAAGP